MKVELNITDMTCGHCAMRVQNSLEEAFPEGKVEVVLAQKIATVDNISEFDAEKVGMLIDDAGYTLAAWKEV
jgi:copper chaperone